MSEFGIHWYSGTSDSDVGNMYGYTTHNRTLKRHVEKICPVGGPEFEDVLHITPPEGFEPIPNKTNWLFTMFEGSVVPEIYRVYIGLADYLFVPCKWCRDLFGDFFPKEKIFVVPHGVESIFRYQKRVHPIRRGKRFRYLWVGAHNPRKGWEEVIILWDRAGFRINPDVELYIKTTNLDRVERIGNCTVDGRNLPRKKLIELYHKSHCFVFPTRGEGFGLTLAEAMRTGLPAIAPLYSGVTEFFDRDVGYPVGYEMCNSTFTFPSRPELGDQPTQVCFPNVADISKWMVWIAQHYEEALEKGRKAHERLKNEFTWERAAKLLVDPMREVYEKRRDGTLVEPRRDEPKGSGKELWV